MSHSLLASLAVAILLVGDLAGAGEKEKPQKDVPKRMLVKVTKIDTKKSEITVQYADDKGKEQQKTFRLTLDVKIFDETGRVVSIDVFKSDNEALILAEEGKLKELRRPARAYRGYRLSDAVMTLIEMTDGEKGSVEEVQRIYDLLRKLDTNKNGEIDLEELNTERERIVAERVKGHIDRLDANKDGKISSAEAQGLIQEQFDRIDRNMDGFIDYDELLHVAKKKHAPKSSQLEKK